MPIAFRCACGRSLRIKDELAGRKVKCPQCDGVLTVPAPAPEEEEVPLLPPEDAGEKPEPRGRRSRPDADEMVQTAPRPARRPARDKNDEDEDDDERSTREKVRRREERAEEREERRREADREQRRLVKRHREEERRDRVRYSEPRRVAFESGWFGSMNAGIVGGLIMILIAGIWFAAGLAAGIIFFYPPILAVIGVVAIIKGVASR